MYWKYLPFGWTKDDFKRRRDLASGNWKDGWYVDFKGDLTNCLYEPAEDSIPIQKFRVEIPGAVSQVLSEGIVFFTDLETAVRVADQRKTELERTTT